MRHTTAKGGTALSEAKKQNYLHGAAIMVGTTVIVKIAAFFYKLPLGSMKLLGDEGFAHFMVAYNIYSFFLTMPATGMSDHRKIQRLAQPMPQRTRLTVFQSLKVSKSCVTAISSPR